MRVIKVGIMSKEQMKDYSIDVAKGKIKPSRESPKIFFPSIRAMSEALNENCQALMSAISIHHPCSVGELAVLVDKDIGNVSRTLKRLRSYGLVDLKKLVGSNELQPVVLVDKIEMEIKLTG